MFAAPLLWLLAYAVFRIAWRPSISGDELGADVASGSQAKDIDGGAVLHGWPLPQLPAEADGALCEEAGRDGRPDCRHEGRESSRTHDCGSGSSENRDAREGWFFC